MIDNKYINKDICTKCGGKCCKKSGCTYYVSDFESLKLEYLEQELDKGYISVVATLMIREMDDDTVQISPFLYLRARNKNRGVIDLMSFKTECASLTSTGCTFPDNKRPSGGVYCMPNVNNELCENKDLENETQKWAPYQNILSRIVKRRTGKTVNAKIKEDVEELIFNYYTQNYDIAGRDEIDEIEKVIPYLKKFYKEEYCKALLRISKTPDYVLKLCNNKK